MYPALIRFDEAYCERLWGGKRMREVLGKPAPADRPVGEAWLIADHANHVSTVTDGGPWHGMTLHGVMKAHGAYLLGSHARPTIHGQFPLLLKILDAADVLSVQVHPDDEAAVALGEPDVGKTEMWHVLESEAGSELICGLDPTVDKTRFLDAIARNDVQDTMRSFPGSPGTSVFVAAGTVHAIGAGILLAEIQQNSDLTYRIYDWDRVDAAGNNRALHLDKAAKVTRFGSPHGGAATPLSYSEGDATVSLLGACRHFATALVEAPSRHVRQTHGRSFHLILARDGKTVVSAGETSVTLDRGAAVLVPAGVAEYALESDGAVMDFFVPELGADVVAPLRAAGHSDAAIGALGGDPATSDVTQEIGP